MASFSGIPAGARVGFRVELVSALAPGTATALAATNASVWYQADAPMPTITSVTPKAAHFSFGSLCRLTIDGSGFGSHKDDVRVFLIPSTFADGLLEQMFLCGDVRRLFHPLLNRTLLTCALPPRLPPAVLRTLGGAEAAFGERSYQVTLYLGAQGTPIAWPTPFEVYPAGWNASQAHYNQVANSAAMVAQMSARVTNADVVVPDPPGFGSYPYLALNGRTHSMMLNQRADNLPLPVRI